MEAVPTQRRTEKRNQPSTKNASKDRVNRRPAQGDLIIRVNYSQSCRGDPGKFHLLLKRTKGSLREWNQGAIGDAYFIYDKGKKKV
jgi:hypothetical protein